ncbi:MAG: hypothetical protein IPK81_05070 [Rhodospirillales bacterium]|nr:MAG: hypothetical protein IPK81_05070 [Rhodospirillales bacterium]
MRRFVKVFAMYHLIFMMALCPLARAQAPVSTTIPSPQPSRLDISPWRTPLVLAVYPLTARAEVAPLEVWVKIANERAIALAPLVNMVLSPLGATIVPGTRGVDPNERIRFQIAVMYMSPLETSAVVDHLRLLENIREFFSVQPHVVHHTEGCVGVALQFRSAMGPPINGAVIYVDKNRLESNEVSCVLNAVFSVIGIPVSANESQWRRGVVEGGRAYQFNTKSVAEISESVRRLKEKNEGIAPQFLKD